VNFINRISEMLILAIREMPGVITDRRTSGLIFKSLPIKNPKIFIK
jgi:hypothetical protein